MLRIDEKGFERLEINMLMNCNLDNPVIFFELVFKKHFQVFICSNTINIMKEWYQHFRYLVGCVNGVGLEKDGINQNLWEVYNYEV